MSKIVRAGAVVRDIEFSCLGSFEVYLAALDRSGSCYRIQDRLDLDDGTIIVRIVSQYRDDNLIEL